ncbi:MAG: hypothetical protein E6I84_01755 [Chloroflexi bacterium]|nr:MAG: hypothetical protein E6J32_04645 [Chloroflexota bacterium]TMD68392.1 MAG: hypothetical protein E6I84_01755 [Chloroflexota bacterium]
MGRSTADRVESALRRADATLEGWFRRGAGVLRRQVNRFQGRLKQVSTGLEQLEKERKPAAVKRSPRPAATKRATRPRKPKKAA